jgi:hypothetical protein
VNLSGFIYENFVVGYLIMDILRYDKTEEPGFEDIMFAATGKPTYTVGRHEVYTMPQEEVDFARGVLIQNPGL